MQNYDQFLKAKKLINQRKYKDAENILRKMHNSQPDNFIIKFELGKLLAKNINTREEGKNKLIELLRTNNKEYAMLELGKLEVLDGNVSTAQSYFEQLLMSNNNKYAILELGKIEVINENYEKAQSYFEMLLTIEDNTYSMLELGKIEVLNGNLSKARYYFEKVMLQQDDKTYAMLELGKLEVLEGNLEEARYYFEQLLTNQNKTYAMLELGKLEVLEGNLEKARYYFKELLIAQNSTYAMLELIYIEINEKNYIEAYKYLRLLVNGRGIRYQELRKIDFYLKYKLGILTEKELENDSYFCRQLVNYNETKTLEHIKLHLDENNFKKTHTTFAQSIEIEPFYRDVKSCIQNINPTYFNYTDKYILELDYVVGSVNGVETNKVFVVTYSNTKDIITIYPTSNEYAVIRAADRKKQSKIKVYSKQMSQIEKFNRKYGLS